MKVVILLAVLPADVRPAMLPLAVRVAYIVNLELKRVLQVVARLLRGESGHHRGPLGNVDDHQIARFGQLVAAGAGGSDSEVAQICFSGASYRKPVTGPSVG